MQESPFVCGDCPVFSRASQREGLESLSHPISALRSGRDDNKALELHTAFYLDVFLAFGFFLLVFFFMTGFSTTSLFLAAAFFFVLFFPMVFFVTFLFVVLPLVA